MSTIHRRRGMWSGYSATHRSPTYQNYPDAPHFFDLLTKAKDHPDKHSVPICHLHVEGMAQSIKLEGGERSDRRQMVAVALRGLRKEREIRTCFELRRTF